jgi:hypothetical protein
MDLVIEESREGTSGIDDWLLSNILVDQFFIDLPLNTSICRFLLS